MSDEPRLRLEVARTHPDLGVVSGWLFVDPVHRAFLTLPSSTWAQLEAALAPADFDRDPAALAWARGRVQFYIDKAQRFCEMAAERGNVDQASGWRRIANFMRYSLIGRGNCVVGAFDERRPSLPWTRTPTTEPVRPSSG